VATAQSLYFHGGVSQTDCHTSPLMHRSVLMQVSRSRLFGIERQHSNNRSVPREHTALARVAYFLDYTKIAVSA
jgi:hypothetical protein